VIRGKRDLARTDKRSNDGDCHRHTASFPHIVSSIEAANADFAFPDKIGEYFPPEGLRLDRHAQLPDRVVVRPSESPILTSCARRLDDAEAHITERAPLPSGFLRPSLRRPFRHGSRIHWDRFTGAIRRRPLPGSPSHMIKPVPAPIRPRVGNKLGTVLATSARCGHNAKTPRWRRASLGFADFKHHRNLFPMPWLWQTYQTQNPVPVKGVWVQVLPSVVDTQGKSQPADSP
jgi:hypothetical protein